MIAKRTKAERAEQRLMSRLREEEEAADVRHRLTNSLQLVLALIAKESANTRNPDVRAALERVAAAVQQLTPAHETIREVGH